MDRGASPNSPTAAIAPAEVVPPFEWAFVWKVGAVGCGLIAVAVMIGLLAVAIDENFDPSPNWPGHTPRLFLVFIGALAAGAAVSMRPDLWQAWAIGAGAALLAVFGTPAHWDSFRLLFGVMTAVALTWTILLAVSSKYRLPALTALLLFHFSGIFFATTSPHPTPWVTEQTFIRVHNPYLQFVYLRNAYHFYSPEPGPASVMVFLLNTYELRDKVGPDGKPVLDDKGQRAKETLADIQKMDYTERAKRLKKTTWVAMPRRPVDVKDPLGLTYYRRLSITEQVARGQPGFTLPQSYEKSELVARRKLVKAIPTPRFDEELIGQYRLPHSEIHRFVIPSYASHVILENTSSTEEASRTTVKMYRLEHSTMSIDEFYNWRKPDQPTSPYHPTTYRPFFLGEFSARGELLDPQEPMLYWLVPITPRLGGVPTTDPTKRDFLDYMTFHALGPAGLGSETTVDQLGEERFKEHRFDWNQLR